MASSAAARRPGLVGGLGGRGSSAASAVAASSVAARRRARRSRPRRPRSTRRPRRRRRWPRTPGSLGGRRRHRWPRRRPSRRRHRAARAPTRPAAPRRRPRRPRPALAPERAMRPSATASATTRVSRPTARIASSLPGIGKSTRSGSQLESRMPMIGMRSLRASSTARCSLFVSTIHTADGRAAHLADTAERLVQLVALAAHLEQLLLGAAAAGHVVEVDLVELLEAVDPLVHRLEVGEHAAQPALVDVGHPDAGRLLGDRLLGLLLGAHEHHGAALGDGLLDEGVRAVDVGQRLLQVDDVDAVALGHDEALHLRVPATGLVSEVDAALEKLAHGDDCHVCSPVVVEAPAVVPALEQGGPVAAPVVFSCCSRRVPAALTLTREPDPLRCCRD